MQTQEERSKKNAQLVTKILIASACVYEILIVILLSKELSLSLMRATDTVLILLGLLFLPFLFLLIGRTLGGASFINVKAGNLEVQVKGLEEKVDQANENIEKKTKELAEQLEGKLSTAEQTLYPLVGGPNEFTSSRYEHKRIIVGSKDFSANIVVAELMAQYLELNGIQCERRIPNGGTITNYAALINGWIDLFVDYTGTGCMLLNLDFHELSKDEILTTLDQMSKERFGFEWMTPLGTKTNYCLVMEKSFADENNINSISDINKHGLGKLRFCANYEFMNRLDGFPGLKDNYKLRFTKENIVSYSDRYNYLVTGEADVSVGHTTDPAIRALKLKVLDDDLHFFPDYYETPLVRTEAMAKIPELRDLLNKIKQLEISNDDITTLIHDYETNADSLSSSVKKILN